RAASTPHPGAARRYHRLHGHGGGQHYPGPRWHRDFGPRRNAPSLRALLLRPARVGRQNQPGEYGGDAYYIGQARQDLVGTTRHFVPPFFTFDITPSALPSTLGRLGWGRSTRY
nr:hypothetical protein [Tanacetum cinerariifolium]